MHVPASSIRKVSSPKINLLLLEVSPILLIDQDQVDVVLDRELVVHVAIRRGEREAAQEQPDRDRLAPHRRPVHDIKLRDRLRLVVQARPGARGFSPPDLDLHVLDFDPHEKKADLAENHVLHVVFGLVVFELDVQAVLDAKLHLDAVVDLRLAANILDSKVKLLDHVGVQSPPRDCHPDESTAAAR